MNHKQELSREALAFLEEQLRSYPRIKMLKKLAEQMDNEKAMSYYESLKSDIECTVESLSGDLKEIVEECFWGCNRHLDWQTIGAVYLGIKRRKAYEIRYQILEEFAINRGFLIR